MRHIKIIVVFFSIIFTCQAFAIKIKILSWNVYFDDRSGQVRYPKIIKHIINQKADVICLQEVTHDFLKRLKSNVVLQQYQFIIANRFKHYTNLTLTKLSIKSKKTLRLTSRMNRVAVYSVLGSSEKELLVVNLHLESMLNDSPIRREQLNFVQEVTRNKKNVLICGDFNFGDVEKDDIKLSKIFFDIGKQNKSFTYDIKNNKLAAKTKFKIETSRRLDRFYIRGSIASTNYKVVKTFLSDHYPILVELKISQ